MTEADILATTYEDICTVYRPYKEVSPDGETSFKNGLDGKVVYSNMPCALSSPTGGKVSKSPSTAAAAKDYSLFVVPGIIIEANDVVVVDHNKQHTLFVAGRAAVYSSHSSIPLQLYKETI